MKVKLIFILSFIFILSIKIDKIYPSGKYADIIIVLDNSGSMKKNDPQFLTATFVKSFISTLENDNSVGLVIFSDKAELISPLIQLSDEKIKENFLKHLSKFDYSGKLTDIPAGIERGLRELKQNGREDSIKEIIFLTDGIIDTGDKNKDKERLIWLRESLIPDCIKHNVNIISIAFTESADYQLIQEIAQKTEGAYYTALKVDDMKGVFEKIAQFVDKKKEITKDKVDAQEVSLEPHQTEKQEALSKESPQETLAPQTLDQKPSEEDNKNKLDKKELLGIKVGIWITAIISTITIVIIIFFLKKYTSLRGDNKNLSFPSQGLALSKIPPAQLIDIGNLTQEKIFPINKQITNIGRSERNDIVIAHSMVSNKHAQIIYKNNEFYIRDVGSTNGTYLNGNKISGEKLLTNGVIIAFGRYKFTFKRDTSNEDITVIDEDLRKTTIKSEHHLEQLKKDAHSKKKLNSELKCGHTNFQPVKCDICKQSNYCEKCMSKARGKTMCPECFMSQYTT